MPGTGVINKTKSWPCKSKLTYTRTDAGSDKKHSRAKGEVSCKKWSDYKQRLEGSEGINQWIPGDRTFQTGGKASTKPEERACLGRRPTLLEQSD